MNLPGHENWPTNQGGGPCECDGCADLRLNRSTRATAAREMAQKWGMPQRIIDRAASIAADSGDPEAAIRAAVERDADRAEVARLLPAPLKPWAVGPNGEILTATEI